MKKLVLLVLFVIFIISAAVAEKPRRYVYDKRTGTHVLVDVLDLEEDD